MDCEMSPQQAKPKFSVYQNPALSAALTAKSLQTTSANICLIFCISMVSAFALLSITSREKRLTIILGRITASDTTAKFIMKILQFVVGLVFMAFLSFLIRALSLRDVRNSFAGARASMTSPSKKMKEQQPLLTDRQLWLLGLKRKPTESLETFKKPPKSRPISYASEPLVPIRKLAHSHTPTRPPQIGSDRQSSSGGKKMVVSPLTPSAQYSVSPTTPWSKQSSSSGKGILTEEMLEQFLADVDEKITESTTKTETPRATICGFGMASPSSVSNSTTSLGTSRSTPLRAVRMSPVSHQKFSTPPKKGEGEFPIPMSMEQTIETFESLGIYPHIELWRDRLRQWFCSVLLNPLVEKIETSHIQVMQAAASVGISITINQVGSDLLTASAPISGSPIDRAKEWQPTFTLHEDGFLHQLRAFLVQARDGSVSQLAGLQQQNNLAVPVIQACVDAITEHQRLHALMKGELVKGLLPQSSVRADYTVQRVRELAEGTCVKNYEYVGSGEVYDKTNKKWTLELPTDSHLLSYLFCAFLDHPKWMLHVDPTSYSGTQSGKNPLFLGILPPKERFPEKYVAVISGVPSIIHPGASILVVGKQSPPIFALYWDKKLQFSLQGRTAMWDSLLLLSYRIKVAYGGVVRGVHLDSSAFNILPVLDSETEGGGG